MSMIDPLWTPARPSDAREPVMLFVRERLPPWIGLNSQLSELVSTRWVGSYENGFHLKTMIARVFYVSMGTFTKMLDCFLCGQTFGYIFIIIITIIFIMTRKVLQLPGWAGRRLSVASVRPQSQGWKGFYSFFSFFSIFMAHRWGWKDVEDFFTLLWTGTCLRALREKALTQSWWIGLETQHLAWKTSSQVWKMWFSETINPHWLTYKCALYFFVIFYFFYY